MALNGNQRAKKRRQGWLSFFLQPPSPLSFCSPAPLLVVASLLSQPHLLWLGKCLLTGGPNYWLFADPRRAEASSEH